jgi:hypothetical protein
MNWISVQEKLPPDRLNVLLADASHKNIRHIMSGYRQNGIWRERCFYADHEIHGSIKITHWMELPSLPIDRVISYEAGGAGPGGSETGKGGGMSNSIIKTASASQARSAKFEFEDPPK